MCGIKNRRKDHGQAGRKVPRKRTDGKVLGPMAVIRRVVAGQEDLRPETSRVKIQEDDLTHKKSKRRNRTAAKIRICLRKIFPLPINGPERSLIYRNRMYRKNCSQADTLKQIVKKSALHLENGRSEFKIDLKPETLGHLKMQILTENHHVTIRILTENHL